MEEEKDHFKGINEQERFNNDLLNELRLIRKFLERNVQTSEPLKLNTDKPIQRRRRKGAANQ